MSEVDTIYLRGIYETMTGTGSGNGDGGEGGDGGSETGTGGVTVVFAADLQAAFNKHLQVTLPLAETDYTVALPDNAKILSLSSTNVFRYALGELAGALAVSSGNTAVGAWGTGGRYALVGIPLTHVLGTGTSRVLHLRSAVAGTIVDLAVA